MESNWYEIMMNKVSEVNRMLGGEGFGFSKDLRGQWEVVINYIPIS